MIERKEVWVVAGLIERDDGCWTHSTGDDFVECPYNWQWRETIMEIEKTYRSLVTPKDQGGWGWRPQEARSVFPNALATKIVATMNLRTWRHVFMMRTTQQAHPQMRQVMVPLLAEFKELIPILYEDIEPDLAQSVSIARAR